MQFSGLPPTATLIMHSSLVLLCWNACDYCQTPVSGGMGLAISLPDLADVQHAGREC